MYMFFVLTKHWSTEAGLLSLINWLIDCFSSHLRIFQPCRKSPIFQQRVGLKSILIIYKLYCMHRLWSKPWNYMYQAKEQLFPTGFDYYYMILSFSKVLPKTCTVFNGTVTFLAKPRLKASRLLWLLKKKTKIFNKKFETFTHVVFLIFNN